MKTPFFGLGEQRVALCDPGTLSFFVDFDLSTEFPDEDRLPWDIARTVKSGESAGVKAAAHGFIAPVVRNET